MSIEVLYPQKLLYPKTNFWLRPWYILTSDAVKVAFQPSYFHAETFLNRSWAFVTRLCGVNTDSDAKLILLKTDKSERCNDLMT